MELHMSESRLDNSNGDLPSGQPPRRNPWVRRLAVGALLVGLGTVSGFAVGKVHGAPGWMWHGMGHRPFDPDRAAKRIEHRVDHVLSRIDATQEQKDKVGGIIKTAMTDITNLGVHPLDARNKLGQLLAADTVDPAAIEALRVEQLGKMDAASKRVTQAMTEAAAVLTPEQRRQLIDRWQKRFSR
jgi:Spy/CpxP family protein refolding chaperone